MLILIIITLNSHFKDCGGAICCGGKKTHKVKVKLIGGKWWVSGFQRKVLGVVSIDEDKG